MSASLLSAESTAAERARALVAAHLNSAEPVGRGAATLLLDYVLGRRSGELDVSGRSTEGTVVLAEARADSPHTVLLVDDGIGLQAQVLSSLAEVVAVNDRIDESEALSRANIESCGAGEPGEAAESGGASSGVQIVADLEAAARITTTTGSADTWAIINAPKAIAALAETIRDIHALASTVIVVGRSDAMSRAVNKELARAYARVDVSPGVGKHRLIIGSRPIPTPSLPSFPKHGVIDHPAVGPLEVRAHGACFSGVKPDDGSMLLLTALAAELDRADGTAADAPLPDSVLDLGCGNGWLLAAALTLTGATRGLGVDVSRAAVASARETLAANGLSAEVRGLDATQGLDLDGADDGFDLVVLNPPFHQGTSIETDTASALMRTAAAAVRPGGRVVTVFNSHLRYRDRLDSIIGAGRQLARNSKFTVVLNERPVAVELAVAGERPARNGTTEGRR